ncbi:hypothetical protein GEMMAAP_11200 [Gemmatimonas phototrophica]|uniref:Uncharacterized protein n=1 Tax=Gemmatimonas phototrophica TaxID=1379270 RepID=A0A143BKZ7_9BACT|nr:hypothetical protein GEMMAAP_11200 [Gemmatimonas phototrophica]
MHNQKQGSSGTGRDAEGGNAAQGAGGYPLGRGYGHDYMRGGEVFGGYGYSDRPEYEKTRGEQKDSS